MKLLVFAHTPPPHHGQSYMVQLMLDGLGGDHRRRSSPRNLEAAQLGIECYHVNARLSTHLEDVGSKRVGKILRLCLYCLEAIWCRFRYGVTTLYYVPAPGKLSAVVRDWLVMALCRPFFKRVILHWHAAGLARWLEASTSGFHRSLTSRALGRADLCVVLSQFNRGEAETFRPRRIRVVGNGIPDPCPDFEQSLLPKRLARLAARRKLASGGTLSAEDLRAAGSDPQVFSLLFLAHCTREKGLFDTLDGVALAAARLAHEQSPIDLRLTVAGEFMNPAEEAEFKQRIQQPDLQPPDGQPRVRYVGFVSGDRKSEVFSQSDCFCFPTYYHAESFGLVVVEALAYGLPVITSRWRSVPELLPADYDALVEPKAPEQIAGAIRRILTAQGGREERQLFVRNYRLDRHLANLATALRSVETEAENGDAPAPALGRPS
jgi:glycosyltransferase involved in cell wall biosynthesis